MESQLVTAKYFRADEIKLPGLRTQRNPINIHTLNTSVDHLPVLDGQPASLLQLPRGKRHSLEWISPFCSHCPRLLRDGSPKLRLNLLPSRPHKETLLPPRSPRHCGLGWHNKIKGHRRLQNNDLTCVQWSHNECPGVTRQMGTLTNIDSEKKALRKTSKKKGIEAHGTLGAKGFYCCHSCHDMWVKGGTTVTSTRELWDSQSKSSCRTNGSQTAVPERKPISRSSNFLLGLFSEVTNSLFPVTVTVWTPVDTLKPHRPFTASSIVPSPRKASLAPLAVGCPPALSWHCVHTSPHLLIKVTVYFPTCPHPQPAGPRTGKLVNSSCCSQGSRFSKTLVKWLQTSRQAKGLKTTGVPKGSHNRWVPGRAGLHPVRAPPCPVHVLPGHRTKERPSSPTPGYPRGHRIGEMPGSSSHGSALQKARWAGNRSEWSRQNNEGC